MPETPIPVTDPRLDPLWADLSTLKVLTCANHPGSRFMSKNPWERHIHVPVGGADCPCPVTDLLYVPEEVTP